MSKFDEKAFFERYPHRVDYFANEQAFLDFVKASNHVRGLLAAAYYEPVELLMWTTVEGRKKCVPNREVLDKINVAWAVQHTNGYSTYLRLYVLLPNAEGVIEPHFTTSDMEFWNGLSDFKVTELEQFVFKIEKT
jgi:hypothetical protein